MRNVAPRHDISDQPLSNHTESGMPITSVKIGAIFAGIMLCLLLWPCYVFVSVLIDWLLGEGAYSAQLMLLPKKLLLFQYLEDFANSLTLVLPIALLFSVEYIIFKHLLNNRFKVANIFLGLMTVLAVTILFWYFFNTESDQLLAISLATSLAVLICKLVFWMTSVSINSLSRLKPDSAGTKRC